MEGEEGGVHGRPRRMYSTPLTYKSREKPTSLFDRAEESSASELATNFSPTVNTQHLQAGVSWGGGGGGGRTLTGVFFTDTFFL